MKNNIVSSLIKDLASIFSRSSQIWIFVSLSEIGGKSLGRKDPDAWPNSESSIKICRKIPENWLEEYRGFDVDSLWLDTNFDQ